MRTLVFAIACAFCAPYAASAHAADPALYSFADVYRMTVSGAMAGQPLVETAPEAPIRVALASADEPRFSVAPSRRAETWILILAGLALAGWVAHRRLAHGL